MSDPIKIGMVNFINTAPLYEIWQERRAISPKPLWQVVEGPPSELNRRLGAAELDMGFISSHEYAQHPGDYRILSDLSISADGRVGSVFLFSEVPVAELDGERIDLSPFSQTSNSLIKIILEDFYHIRPVYQSKPLANEPGRAVLAIGDLALRLRQEGRYREIIDLSMVWRQHTGQPFVFAVWVVREDSLRRFPAEVRAIHRELRQCVLEGRRRLSEISAMVAPRIPMLTADCYAYLQKIEYDLGPAKIFALETYYQYLLRRGEADSGALPLKIL
ncbi:MAG: menaquinone biosynthesis protein [Deltaproteobacteria bacterium]|nr:menaquinone biosynthesis protein [Deltaproteobacteria bacterium]